MHISYQNQTLNVMVTLREISTKKEVLFSIALCFTTYRYGIILLVIQMSLSDANSFQIL